MTATTGQENAARVCHGDTVLTAGERNSFVYTIQDPVGIHARPAGALVRIVKGYKSKITFSAGGKTVNAVSIINVMSLGAVCGTRLTVEASGKDADEAIAALRDYFRNNL